MVKDQKKGECERNRNGKAGWQNNYDGREELGIMTVSNTFPPDEYYGSSAETLFNDIQDRIEYICRERMILDQIKIWVPTLHTIHLMLNIIVSNDTHFIEKMGELRTLYEKVILLLPSSCKPATCAEPSKTMETALQERKDKLMEKEIQEKDEVIIMFNNYDKMIQIHKEAEKKAMYNMKKFYVSERIKTNNITTKNVCFEKCTYIHKYIHTNIIKYFYIFV
jgi:hypothetical protein